MPRPKSRALGFLVLNFWSNTWGEFKRKEREAREGLGGLWGEYLISTSYATHGNHRRCRIFKGKEG
jgi:hypothetical protein